MPRLGAQSSANRSSFEFPRTLPCIAVDLHGRVVLVASVSVMARAIRRLNARLAVRVQHVARLAFAARVADGRRHQLFRMHILMTK